MICTYYDILQSFLLHEVNEIISINISHGSVFIPILTFILYYLYLCASMLMWFSSLSIFINNLLNPVSTSYLHIDVQLSNGRWTICQWPYSKRKVICIPWHSSTGNTYSARVGSWQPLSHLCLAFARLISYKSCASNYSCNVQQPYHVGEIFLKSQPYCRFKHSFFLHVHSGLEPWRLSWEGWQRELICGWPLRTYILTFWLDRSLCFDHNPLYQEVSLTKAEGNRNLCVLTWIFKRQFDKVEFSKTTVVGFTLWPVSFYLGYCQW